MSWLVRSKHPINNFDDLMSLCKLHQTLSGRNEVPLVIICEWSGDLAPWRWKSHVSGPKPCLYSLSGSLRQVVFALTLMSSRLHILVCSIVGYFFENMNCNTSVKCTKNLHTKMANERLIISRFCWLKTNLWPAFSVARAHDQEN